MTYWIGFGLFIVGACLLYGGFAHKNKVLAARREAAARGNPEEPEALHPSLAMLGDVMPGLITGALVFVGLKATFFFLAFGGRTMFSVVDLAGFLFVLAAYGTWITLRTKYRDPGLVTAPARAATAPAPVLEPEREELIADVVGSPRPVGASPGVRRHGGIRDVAADLAPAGEAAPASEPARRRAG